MTPEDRELLHALRRQQLEIQRSLARLDSQLAELEVRSAAAPAEIVPPPFPSHPPELPPLPPHVEPISTSIHETHIEFPPLPSAPESILHELPPVPKPSLEFQFGKWLTRIGAVFLVLSVVFFAIWADVNFHLYQRLGAFGKLGIMGFVSVGVLMLGHRLERKNPGLLVYGRTLMAAGLACLYFTFYAAHYIEPLRVIHSPLFAGFLLLLWSAYVFILAERKKSQLLSLFAITLAYVSSALNPVGAFTMGADLLLAATAVLFLLRNGWAALSYFSLIGTYLALLRRLVIDDDGEIVFDSSHTLHFWPHAIYLIGAWLIFTTAVLFSSAPAFRGGKRLAFLSLNNGLFAGLLALTAHVAGYDYGTVGWNLLAAGGALLLVSGFARWTQPEPREVGSAYLAQGLALFTAGLIVVYAGISRGVLLALETLFLGAAGTYSRNRVLIAFTYVTAFFATLFLIWEIAYNAHHPWLLGVGGALVMLFNAWWSRRDVRHDVQTRQKIVLSSSYYCVLALGLIYAAMCTELSDSILPSALALVALGFTFSIYLVPLYELPPAAQTFLLSAQALVLFPADTGETLPWWSTAWVAAITLLTLTWWSRQRVTRRGSWIILLNLIYALALVGLAYHAVRPYVNSQDWMIAASFLSVIFLVWGAFTRVWPLAIMGQVFLFMALYHFFALPSPQDLADGWDMYRFPWTWWAAAVPLAVVFATGRGVHAWLRTFPEITGSWRDNLLLVAYGYQILALVVLIRWIAGVIPHSYHISAYLFLGTFLLAWNALRTNSFGIRCSFVLSAMGMLLYVGHFDTSARAMATFINGLALLGFLTQSAMLRHAGKVLVTQIENWALILLSVTTGWLFVSAWVETRIHANYLTMGWALYAFFLFLFGLLLRERRQRWCGLAILLAAIVRVFIWDFWGFSSGYRVLTFIVLTIITLGLGFIYARFADRLKTWL